MAVLAHAEHSPGVTMPCGLHHLLPVGLSVPLGHHCHTQGLRHAQSSFPLCLYCRAVLGFSAVVQSAATAYNLLLLHASFPRWEVCEHGQPLLIGWQIVDNP